MSRTRIRAMKVAAKGHAAGVEIKLRVIDEQASQFTV